MSDRKDFISAKDFMAELYRYKKGSVTEVSSALNLNFTPASFWAFFPKDLEGELSRLEVAYGNKQPEQIEETVFEVTVRAGTSQVVVASQKLKK